MNVSFSYLWLIAPITAILGLLVAKLFSRRIRSEPMGTEAMNDVSNQIKLGALTYLQYLYKVSGSVLFLIFILLCILALLGLQAPFSPLAFLTGGVWAAMSGYICMQIAANGATRTAEACKTSLQKGLMVAFRSGAAGGITVASFGLLIISLWFILLNFIYDKNIFGVSFPLITNIGISIEFFSQNLAFQKAKFLEISTTMLTFAMGASLVALFSRIGGGVFAKSADIGADLTGKMEQGFLEDDQRNPASIADNIGDLVSGIAGMSADLSESYAAIVLACIALGASLAFRGYSIGALQITMPLMVFASGLISSIIGILLVRPPKQETKVHNLLKALVKGTGFSNIILFFSLIGFVHLGYISWRVFGAISIGLIAGIISGQFTEYFTSDRYPPSIKIAQKSLFGTSLFVLKGFATGLISSGIPGLIMILAMISSFLLAGGLENASLGFYGVAYTSLGMLSIVSISITINILGPLSDNASGIVQMSKTDPDVRSRTMDLKILGNTISSSGKGFVISSAALTTLALLSTYMESIKEGISRLARGNQIKIGQMWFTHRSMVVDNQSIFLIDTLDISNLVEIFKINIANPQFIAGLMIGGISTFVFSGLVISEVTHLSQLIMTRLREHFLENNSKEEEIADLVPETIQFFSKKSIQAMIIPVIFALSIPLLVGLFFHIAGIVGLLIGALSTGYLLASTLNNTGESMASAKKYIEKGNIEGDGISHYEASIIGDAIGDAMKDTAGPSLNILIKLMCIESIVFAGIILKFGIIL